MTALLSMTQTGRQAEGRRESVCDALLCLFWSCSVRVWRAEFLKMHQKIPLKFRLLNT